MKLKNIAIVAAAAALAVGMTACGSSASSTAASSSVASSAAASSEAASSEAARLAVNARKKGRATSSESRWRAPRQHMRNTTHNMHARLGIAPS